MHQIHTCPFKISPQKWAPFLMLMAIGLALMIPMVGCNQKTETAKSSASGTASETALGTVELNVDFGERKARKELRVPCSRDSTVYSILERARNMGDLTFHSTDFQGKAFVRSIDDIENEGASGDNWTYSVNGTLAKVGCSDFTVKPKDTITWKLGRYDMSDAN